jgi:ABC-type antimicrobial peptide transport system permease subunit
VREGWTKKGVAFAIVSALDRKSLALFVLVLVVSALFLANGAFASVRSRRTEIGTLLCLGWGRGRIFRATLGELALVGLTAGLVGTGLAFLLVKALSLDMAPLRTLLVAPVAVALACLAGFVPAWRAARAVPLDAVRPPVVTPRRARPIRGLARMAAANLLRLPGRTLLGAGALLVGVAALAFLLSVNLAFKGTLVGTLLGEVISVQVRGVDYLSVALAIALGGLSVADVLVLNLKERAPELVTLRTTGWRESHLARLVVMEGVGIGVVGALLGAGVGLALAVAVGGPVGRVVSAALLAALAGVAVAALASLVPALLTSRMTPPTVLAEE